MKCGLLGKKLGHSFSPQIHNMLSEYSYTLFEREQEELVSFFQDPELRGCNVTIPYKKTVLPFCDVLTPVAQRLGAVNTIVRREDGTLVGHNTDYYGFQTMLDHSTLSVAGKKALVLGSGGASATVCAVLQDRGANVVIISRTGENNYSNLDIHKDCAFIVNTTPVGMYPNVNEKPLDLSLFQELEGVLDVIYNPERTDLLLEAESRGIVTENGLRMLIAQAKESAEWFSGHEISDSFVSTAYDTILKQTENIILIGMPGCGKTTIGKRISQKTGMRFVDTDELFCKEYGISSADVIISQGEEVFRKMESRILYQAGRESGCVIATGGGCVLRSENYSHLHRNGKIFYIKRDLSLLPTDGRPLSQNNSLEALFSVRSPLYQSFADDTILNNRSITDAVDLILSMR